MYLTILKKDMKRKKTMNFIILLFVIMSSMFLASGVNNIISVASGTDRYLDMAGMEDMAAIVSEPYGKGVLDDRLNECVPSAEWKKESSIAIDADCILIGGEKAEGFSGYALAVSPDNDIYSYFDADNRLIEEVPDGSIYVTNSFAAGYGLETGDIISIVLGADTYGFELSGVCKDAVFGSEMMENPRFLISRSSYDTMLGCDEAGKDHCSVYYIRTADTGAVNNVISKAAGVRFSASRSMIKTAYIVDMLTAGIVMAVSIFLILIALVVLRFTIGFSIAEEFREIGVMKALGLKNTHIRMLYLVKYLAISAAGTAIGSAAAFPFGDMLLSSASSNMVITGGSRVPINILCCTAVIIIILLFSWSCTAKIKKLSPIDAVRSGQTGERFRKHSTVMLGRSRLGADAFLSVSDVLSSPKQTAILTAVFTLCALLVMILSNTAATLTSESLIYLIGVEKSDIYLVNNSPLNDIISGKKTAAEATEEVRTALAENGIKAGVRLELQYSVGLAYGGNTSSARFLRCSDTKCSDYRYDKGTAPQYADEIAVTFPVAEELGADIGDTVEVTVNGRTERFIITAMFDSLNGLGKCGRFSEEYDIPDTAVSNIMAFQIDLDDPGRISGCIDTIKEIYGTDTVYDCAGYVKDCTKAADTVTKVKHLTLIVAVCIMIMMTVLIERSFISKERAEIALMKAIGFGNRSVIKIHVLRFVIISVCSLVLAAVLGIPATKLAMDPIFAMMGASGGIAYSVNIAETFFIYPAVIFASVIAGSFVISLFTAGIKASDTADIE